jgi:hypothetical protein
MLQYIYHYIKDMEFSGVFDAGLNPKSNGNVIYLKYFLFIKFGDLIYIDIKSVGAIIIPFEELMKHTYLKLYYELSLVLTKNKHKIIETKTLDYYSSGEYNKTIYKEKRDWFIDCAYFIEDFSTKIKKVETGKYYCYYNINPNDLRNMNVSNTMDILKFYEVLNIRYGYEQARIFKGIFTDYTNLMLEYNIKMVGEEIDEISASQEDNKNIVNLLELNNKKGMNMDIFRILYENIISAEGQKKYSNFVDC